tara:strand:- start:173 stop:490 length:318 start_codon:yes stop_codon:yes gene_type:complete
MTMKKRIDEDFEYIYFFKDAFRSKLIGRPNLINTGGFNAEEVKQVKDFIKKNGEEFYTVDDDGLDKTEGYYYSKDGLDFEPLDKMTADSGHTQMFYKEGGQWKQL